MLFVVMVLTTVIEIHTRSWAIAVTEETMLYWGEPWSLEP